jgi:secreted PhoX family phosphatase
MASFTEAKDSDPMTNLSGQARPSHADVDDEDLNTSTNASFGDVLDARLSRRSVLRGGVGTAASALFGGVAIAGLGGGSTPAAAATAYGSYKNDKAITSLAFTPVAKSVADLVSVPPGYSAHVVVALGDPLDDNTPEYRNDGTDTGFEHRSGDHHDGMEFFGLSGDGRRVDRKGSVRGLLAINHEATSNRDVRSYYLHPTGGTLNPRPAGEADKEMAIHGISVVEVRKTAGRFAYVRHSSYNRRVTPLTPVELSGPAAGHALMATRYSNAGVTTRGTINNCGTGMTPWGTYLSGEENWFGYFYRGSDAALRAASDGGKSNVSLARYGRNPGAASRHGWETAGSADRFVRWDITQGAGVDATSDYRNEINTYGWIVELDPYNPSAAVRKRTALGRFAHEGAAFGLCIPGQPLAAYMGDDARGEYIYKFVSEAAWKESDREPADRMATGNNYLDRGRLYVARFDADGSGEWLELTMADPRIANYAGYAFADQADVLINARLAADAVGATKMDRPEWCTVNPVNGEIYYTLTNNSNRKITPTGSQLKVDAANPRAWRDSFAGGALGSEGNINGHIIRMRENSGAASTAFAWDVYLFGAQADADSARVNLSALTDHQDFSSPDGIWFSPNTKLCWIQTDDGSYTDVTNCMMLAAVPGQLGDGSPMTLNYTLGDGSVLPITTFVGAKPAADKLKRFLVGPVDCEITGVAETADGRALFVNIQHPGETLARAEDVVDPSKYLSHWPGNAGYGPGGAAARPRSATIVITKDDGGRIGS